MSLLKAVMQGESPLLVGGSAFLFYSGLQLIEQGPPTLGRKICFTRSTNCYSHPETSSQTQSEQCLTNAGAPPAQSSRHTKPTTTGPELGTEIEGNI